MNTRQNELDLRSEVEALKQRLIVTERRNRVNWGLAMAVITGALLLSPGSRTAIAQGYGLTLQQLAARMTADETNITSLQTRATALEGKTQFMTASASGKWTAFTGANVYIQNGLGATNGNPKDGFNPKAAVTNSLGNLIIGYNVEGGGTGSHNLILGDFNNYTSYGGMVAGFNNTISGDYATVTGGAQNHASGSMSSVSGGLSNQATGVQSWATGGQNLASGDVSTVGGGVNNVASGYVSTVSGGLGITQSNAFGWSGGSFHTP